MDHCVKGGTNPWPHAVQSPDLTRDNEQWVGEVCQGLVSAPQVDSQWLHPSFQRSLVGKPACLQIHWPTSAPKFTFLLSQSFPNPPQCDLGTQTFHPMYCNTFRSFCSTINTGEFCTCPCIVFLPVNILILLSCIPPFVFPTNSSSRRKSVYNMNCQMSLGIIRKLCCGVLRACIFQGIQIHNVCIFDTYLHLWISMPFGALPVEELPDCGEKVDSQKENGSVHHLV